MLLFSYLRLGMPNYTGDCYNGKPSTVLLTELFRQTTVHRSEGKITAMCVMFTGTVPVWLQYPWHYRAGFDTAGTLWSPISFHLIHTNRGSCSISYCLTKRQVDVRFLFFFYSFFFFYCILRMWIWIANNKAICNNWNCFSCRLFNMV